MAAETRKELCERLFAESMAGTTERAWLDGLFTAYEQSDKLSVQHFLADEVLFTGGHVKRAILEKIIAPIVLAAGGRYEPRFTEVHDVRTSHYTLYRLGELAITLSAVGERSQPLRAARFREEYQAGRIPKSDMAFSFVLDPIPEPAEDSTAWIVFKHGKKRIDSSIPQFAVFQGLDQRGFVVWNYDLFAAQIDLAEDLLNKRATQIPDDGGIPTLKEHLRRIRERRKS
uniref:Uncharacterized protein n=1 Tax=mine drainage metagenome TaxID=410659 RepID=E6Q1B1_9ZZZZ